ncbi:MAG: MMPL family transporter [Bacillus sp. (in: firmicutes)]
MEKVRNWRTFSLVVWLVLSIVTILTMPDLDQLVREKGQTSIPETAQSEVANDLLNQMEGDGEEAYQIIAVFNSGDEKALTDGQLEKIEDAIGDLKAQQSELGITNMLTHLDSEDVEAQLKSADGTTILTQLTISKEQGTISEVKDEIEAVVQLDNVDSYLTGNELVIEDFSQSTQDGIKKTEIIAVVFILVVLIIVFRSPVVPIVSLLLVGVSYVVSLGIIAHLVDQFNYPFSNFTQVFLVVILFGIGTDYNILLFTRFKEELAQKEDVLSAIAATYKTAGKTVIYSGVAVFIGFISLILAEFSLYQASSAVAIGVAVLILVLLTLNPFFMAVLGKKMFWPSKKFEGHADSKIWGTLSKISVLRPIVSLLFVGILCVPFVLHYSDAQSYNDLVEVADSYTSKQGINIIEEHFEPGFSSPATLVIQSEEPLNNAKSLQAIDEIVDKIAKTDGVAQVYSATRPTGEKINELYLNDQTNTLNEGIGTANDGVEQIHEGLSSAEEQVGQTDTSGLDNVQTLIDGTEEVKSGVNALGSAIQSLSDGIADGAVGAEQLETGLNDVSANMDVVANSMEQLQAGYTELQKGLQSFSDYFASIVSAIDGAQQGYEQIETALTSVLASHPELADDVNFQTSLGVASAGKQQLAALSGQLAELTPQYEAAMSSFEQANGSFAQVNAGFDQLQTGVTQLQTGSSELKAGLQAATDGSNQIASQTPKLESGLTQISGGQEQLLAGLTDLTAQMEELQSGLSESTDGLSEISTGLTDAQNYLSSLSESDASETFYIPEEQLQSEEFQEALNMYMSEDRTMTRMNIILEVNPYTKEAMEIVENLDKELQAAVSTSGLGEVQFALGGKSSQNVDLEEMASGDFTRTATIMLVGIGLVLVFITRSVTKPLLIIGALIAAYYTSLGMSELVTINLLDVEALGWNVAFFSFIMIVALGVDYSIFFMMRYRELDGHSTAAIVDAARHIGGVVISAAIILGGTFAALIPSGVVSLMEIATTVIIGLLLLSFVLLPIFIPAVLGIIDRLGRLGKKDKQE